MYTPFNFLLAFRSIYLINYPPMDLSFGNLFCLFLFLHTFHNLLKLSCYITVIFSFVRNHTIGAILNPLFGIPEIPPAVSSKGIQWAITKQTIKIVCILCRMAGKEFTGFVAEKRIILSFPCLLMIRFLMIHLFLYLSQYDLFPI
jgi:hypothetical protein